MSGGLLCHLTVCLAAGWFLCSLERRSTRGDGLADPFSTTDSSVVGHRTGHIELTRWEMLVASPELGSNQRAMLLWASLVDKQLHSLHLHITSEKWRHGRHSSSRAAPGSCKTSLLRNVVIRQFLSINMSRPSRKKSPGFEASHSSRRSVASPSSKALWSPDPSRSANMNPNALMSNK